MACRTGCRTKDHANWGECLKAASLTIAPAESGAKAVDFELQSYANARKQGIQPASTKLAATQAAVAISERRGSAFDAGKEVLVSG
jgi:hypothetical protein